MNKEFIKRLTSCEMARKYIDSVDGRAHQSAVELLERAENEIEKLRLALDALLFIAAKTECKHESQVLLLQEAMNIAVEALEKEPKQ